MELSKNVAIDFKPCATDAKTFNYVLNKPITPEMYEFFKPFGILNFEMGKSRLGEVYILDSKTKQPIECQNWLDRTSSVPTYLHSSTVERFRKIRDLVEAQLHSSRVEGLLAMYDKLSETEKQIFRKLLSSRN